MNTVPIAPNAPPVPAGFNGNLSSYQKAQLKKLWVRTLEACEYHPDVSNRVRMVGGPSAVPKPPIEYMNHAPLTKAPDLVFGDQGAISESFKERHYTPPHALTNVYGGPLLREAFWQSIAGDFADDIFLRFLRARNFDVEAALSFALQVLSAWYDLDVAGILKRGEEKYLSLFHRGPAYIQGYTTVDGTIMPLFIVNPARMLAGGRSTEALQAFIVLITQYLHQLTVSQNGRAVFIVDLYGFNEKSLDWQTVLFSIKYLQMVMVERMEVTFLHRMPWAFRGVWHTILPMLDPTVRAKIRFSHRPQDLEQYASLDLLPVHLGGTAQWQWRYLDPRPGEEAVMSNLDTGEMIELELQELMKSLDQVSMEWAEVSVGDPREADIDFHRSVLQVQVRLKQLQLRPYVYATNVYNRLGILDESGSVTWVSTKSGPSVTPEVLTLFREYSIPGLIEWLEQHGQDTMQDSFGGRYGACGVGRSPELIPLYVREKHSSVASSVESSAASAFSSPIVSTAHLPAPEATEDYDIGASTGLGLSSPGPSRPRASSVSRTWANLGDRTSQGLSPHLPSSARRTSLSSQMPDKSSVTSSLQQVSSVPGNTHEEGTPTSEAHSSTLDTPPGPSSSGMPSAYNSGSSSESEHSFNWIPSTKIAPSYIPKRTLTRTDVALSDTDLEQDRQTVRVARDLFMAGRIGDIGDIVTRHADVRPYSAAAMAMINSLRAFVSFEPDDLVASMHCCAHAIGIVELLRKKRSKFGRILPLSDASTTYATMSNVQLHAEMLAAELRIILAIVTSVQTKSKTTMTRVVLMLKRARKIILGLTDYIQAMDEECERATVQGKKPSRILDEDLRSGVLLARSVFLFVSKTVPQGVSTVLGLPQSESDAERALKYALAPGGWSSARMTPLISVAEEGLQRPMADLTALMIQLLISQFYPVPSVNLELCDAIVTWNLTRFPDSPILLHAQARLFLNQALPERAIELLHQAIKAWKATPLPGNVIHMCLWDLATCYIIIGDWQTAYDCYDTLSKNSNWTKSMFQYLKGAVLHELDASQVDRVTTIMRTVPMLSRSGLGPASMEAYENLRAEKFFTPGRKTTVLVWEHMYLFHLHRYMPIFTIVQDYLPRLENNLAYLTNLSSPEQHGCREDYYAGLCVTRILKGVALSYICYPQEGTIARLPPNSKMGTREEMAEEGCRSFEASFECTPYLEGQDRSLIYFGHLELARLHFRMGQIGLAKRECQRILSGKDLAPGASTGLLAHGQPPAPMSHMYLIRTQRLLDDIMCASVP